MKSGIKTRFYKHYNLQKTMFWIAYRKLNHGPITLGQAHIAWFYDSDLDLF